MNEPQLIDAHCHLDAASFNRDRDAAWARARQAGVTGAVIAGVSPERWRRARAFAGTHEGVVFTVGLHPWELEKPRGEELMETLTEAAVGARGIGECGVDRDIDVPLSKQLEVVETHRDVAESQEMPLVLHAVGHHGALLGALARRGPLRFGGMVHGYSGSAELVRQYVALGLMVSFGANITRPGARRAPEALRAAPLDALLFETDAPDQPPFRPGGVRPARNEPAFLPEIVAEAARIRGERFDVLAKASADNARRLFSLA